MLSQDITIDTLPRRLIGVTTKGAGFTLLHPDAALDMIGNCAYLESGKNFNRGYYDITDAIPGESILVRPLGAFLSGMPILDFEPCATGVGEDGVLLIGTSLSFVTTKD